MFRRVAYYYNNHTVEHEVAIVTEHLILCTLYDRQPNLPLPLRKEHLIGEVSVLSCQSHLLLFTFSVRAGWQIAIQNVTIYRQHAAQGKANQLLKEW